MNHYFTIFFAILLITSISVIPKLYASSVSYAQSHPTAQWDECVPHGKVVFRYSPTPNNESPLDPSTINAKSQDSIVFVEVNGPQGTFTGSGVVFDACGDIVTNNHVIDGAESISVKTKDSSTYTATLIGTDRNNDIAVLHIPTTTKDFLKFDADAYIQGCPKIFGDSYVCYGPPMAIGEKAYALGNPDGIRGTFTEGIISNRLPANSFNDNGPPVIVIDTTINPGSSGGALLDKFGLLIGITEAGNERGLNFAIPMSFVTPSIMHILGDYHKEVKCSILESDNTSGGHYTGNTDTPSCSAAGYNPYPFIVVANPVNDNNVNKNPLCGVISVFKINC